MTRRRPGALVVFAALAALTGGVRLFAPDRFDAAVASGETIVDRTPEPVVLGVTVVVLSLVGFLLIVYILRAYYWAWRQIEEPVTRLWNAVLPESPIVRFGVGIIIMVLVFLIGPLVVLQTLDFFEDGEGPVEEQRDDDNDSDPNNTTDEENEGTANVHTADEPDSPDEPPDGPVGAALG
jgi:hypothetical protein